MANPKGDFCIILDSPDGRFLYSGTPPKCACGKPSTGFMIEFELPESSFGEYHDIYVGIGSVGRTYLCDGCQLINKYDFIQAPIPGPPIAK